MAPGLVQLAKHRQSSTFQILGIATTDAASVQSFVNQHAGMNWPIAHSTNIAGVARLGAFNETFRVAGYEAKPLLMLIDPQGRLVWTDEHSRFKHLDPDQSLRELEAAIDKDLEKKVGG
jgi:hypothetical protein